MEAGRGVGEAELKGAYPAAENRPPEMPRKVRWQLVGMGSWSPQGKVAFFSGAMSLSRLGTSPGTSTAAGFITPWDPRFVKGESGSPDTGTGEDEFPFSAVRLPTPLILRVQMMNFFLLFIFPPASPPTALPRRRQRRTDGALQGSRSAQEDTEAAHSRATWAAPLGEALISSGRGSSNDCSIPHELGDGWRDGEEPRRRGCSAGDAHSRGLWPRAGLQPRVPRGRWAPLKPRLKAGSAAIGRSQDL